MDTDGTPAATAPAGPVEPNPLAAHIDALDPRARLGLLELSGVLKGLVGERVPTADEVAEQFAVLVIGRRRGTLESPWGGYYGPMTSFRDESNNVFENPPLQLVTPDTIRYWVARSVITLHPVMKARYADLAWDLWKRVQADHPGIEVARQAIDAYVQVLDEQLDDADVWSEATMGRALALARSVKDEARTQAVIAACIRRQASCTDPDAPGTWGMAFNVLLGPNGPQLEPGQVRELVGGIEAHVTAGLSKVRETGIPHPTITFVQQLAEYYRRSGQRLEVERVLASMTAAMLEGNQSPSGLVRMAWLEGLDELLREHGLTALRQRLAAPMRRAGEESLEGLHTIKSEVKIPTERVREFVDEFSQHTGDALMGLIAGRFVTSREDIARLVVERSERAVFTSLVTRRILDPRGRAVATVGSVQDDPQGNLIAQAALALQINTLFLQAVLEEVRKSGALSEEVVLAFCARSPGLVESRQAILRRGVAAYLAGDWVASVHLLVPAVEDGIRELARCCGPMPIEVDPITGGWSEPGLGKVLRLTHLSEQVGPDLVLHWQTLLTDPRGLNLRNRVAHGLVTDAECTREAADRVLHALLQVGMFRSATEDDPDD